MKLFISLGAISGFLAVAIGAFGAHLLKNRLDDYSLGIYHTGVQYQFYHAFALIAAGLLLHFFPQGNLYRWSGWLFLSGTILFSGSLYVLALSGIKGFGAITPFGGLCFLAGWALLLIQTLKLQN